MNWDALAQPIVIISIFIVSSVGGLIIWQLKENRRVTREAEERIHARIDKYNAELDEHIKEGIQVHRSLERIETTIDLHMRNGHRHSGDS